MNASRRALLAACLVSPLAACDPNPTVVVNRLVTADKERADLKRALDAGAITQEQYEEQLQKLGG